MRLIILIPTYQRPSTLIWSLQSVIRQKFANSNFTKKIIILNNDPDYKTQVDQSVKQVVTNNPDHEFDAIEIIQGNTAISTIKGVYDNLKAITENGDIAIIHGDDDIMLPNSLLFRYNSALASKLNVFIVNCLWSCFFVKQKAEIFLDTIDNPYEPAKPYQYSLPNSDEVASYALPFISIYTYKISDEFWSIYDLAIQWSDQLPFEPRIKYPFIPFYIGLAAYHTNQLGVANVNMAIRGQLFSKRFFLPPLTVTEYANGGIILLTGLAVLNNNTLKNNPDFHLLRKNHREATRNHIFQSFARRDGLSIAQLFSLYRIAEPAFTLKEFTTSIILKNCRQLFNNILFTANLKRWFVGWGKETSIQEFWEKWDQHNAVK
jgi:glycosyltransferase involved in cell wall biosynthesis